MSSVWVLNTSDDDLKDGFDGKNYDFKVGVSVEIPLLVAKHVFGYLDADKEPHLVRLGWVKLSTDVSAGLARLEKFKISPEPIQNHHYQSPVVGRIPLPPTKGGGGKGTQKVA